MKIAIASGKGGTGKTTVATNLAKVIVETEKNCRYLDCDVEEPNGHIFLKPIIEKNYPATVDTPAVDLQKCNGCGKCAEICQYSAIVCLKAKPLTFDNLCHSCGGCKLICPVGAITEQKKNIGTIETGTVNRIAFSQGKLNIGDIHTVALIKSVKQTITNENSVNIIDAPPGTSCPVIAAVSDCDFVLLVTEPTPFGLNDLRLAVEMVKVLKMPFAVAINRSSENSDIIRKYCKDENIEIIFELKDDRRIAENYSKGIMLADALPEYKENFIGLYYKIKELI